MDNEFNGNFKEIDWRAEASNELSMMDVDENIDFNGRLREMKENINYYKSKLQSCRDKYERAETEIRDVRQLQRDALFALNNARGEEEDLHIRLRNIHLNYETCGSKSDGQEDMDETIRAKIRELTELRNTLTEEMAQLRQTANNNGKKLAQVNVMITEQEERNVSLLGELERKSEDMSIPQDIRRRINAILKNLEIEESEDITDDAVPLRPT